MKSSKFVQILFVFCIIVCLQNCTSQRIDQTTDTTEKTMQNEIKEKVIEIAIDEDAPIRLDYMDTSVKPGDDFYRYVNGRWDDKTEIPDDQNSWGSFNMLRLKTDETVLELLNKASNDSNLNPTSDQAKAVYLYQSFLDTATRNELGIRPLEPYFEKIDKINDTRSLEDYLISMANETGGLPGLLSFNVFADGKNSSINVGYLDVGHLGMKRDYYVEEDEKSKEMLAKYEDHVARMLGYMGYSEEKSDKVADEIVEFETALAKPRLDKVQRRDRNLTYNKYSKSEVKDLTNFLSIIKIVNSIGANDANDIIVMEPDYIKALDDVLNTTDMSICKEYLKWSLLKTTSNYLSTEIEDANWEFYGKTMTGAPAQRPRDERALLTINNTIGEALGKLYVDEMFPPEAKTKAVELIEYVKKAYEKRINMLPWMSEETKIKAIEKLYAMRIKIGYPDQWKDFSSLDIREASNGGNLFNNMLAVSKWAHEDNMAKIDKEVDKSEWFMPPQMVNAYYNPYYNEIVFPAAILQPPFYNYKADEAVNFGAMGAVIGHEISHGFDDSGADFDKDGNLSNWWTEEDLSKFTDLGGKLAEMYSNIEVLPDVHINGEFTLGENIGDLGGVNSAYTAMELYLADHGTPDLIDGFTAQQRFFLSWTTVWRTKFRDEALIERVKGDPHSPGMYRAYVPLQNMDSFYEAFEISQDQDLYLAPEERVQIW